jgi:hypothetical protein
MTRLSPNLTTEEGRCRCGCGLGDKVEDYPLDFVALLQAMRDIKGAPIWVNSWLRCVQYNALVGGVANSAHPRGTAADLGARNAADRYDLIVLAILAAIRELHHLPGIDWHLVFMTIRDVVRGIGVGKTFVHVDNDRIIARPAAWGYGEEGRGG